jgi:hypothetical protein
MFNHVARRDAMPEGSDRLQSDVAGQYVSLKNADTFQFANEGKNVRPFLTAELIRDTEARSCFFEGS